MSLNECYVLPKHLSGVATLRGCCVRMSIRLIKGLYVRQFKSIENCTVLSNFGAIFKLENCVQLFQLISAILDISNDNLKYLILQPG